jgi:hypothetical protein
MLLIASTVDQSDRPLFNLALQQLNLIRVMPELSSISAGETSPFGGIVPEPLPKLRTRRELFQPQIQFRLFFGQTSRPEPVHENARAVSLLRFFIDPFDSWIDVVHRDLWVCVAHALFSACEDFAAAIQSCPAYCLRHLILRFSRLGVKLPNKALQTLTGGFGSPHLKQVKPSFHRHPFHDARSDTTNL